MLTKLLRIEDALIGGIEEQVETVDFMLLRHLKGRNLSQSGNKIIAVEHGRVLEEELNGRVGVIPKESTQSVIERGIIICLCLLLHTHVVSCNIIRIHRLLL